MEQAARTAEDLPTGAWDLAVSVAREAGALLRDRLHDRRRIEFKGLVDLVTDADRASEALIAARIHAIFPEHLLYGEEGSRGARDVDDAASPYTWVFDPLDGTTNYAHGYPHFAVAIALARDETSLLGVVYDPMRDELFAARRGGGATLNGEPIQTSNADQLIQSLIATGFAYDVEARAENMALWDAFLNICQGSRRDGAAALNLCYVAAGRLDGFWERPLQPWDMAAGALIVAEAGGTVTSFANGPYRLFDREVITTNGLIHDQMLAVIERHAAPLAAASVGGR